MTIRFEVHAIPVNLDALYTKPQALLQPRFARQQDPALRAQYAVPGNALACAQCPNPWRAAPGNPLAAATSP